jgi:hypothetical protein
MFYLTEEQLRNDDRIMDLIQWLHSISNDDKPMDNMFRCDSAIYVILETLGRSSLNPFQTEEEFLNLISELKEEPRSENSNKNQFLNLFIPNEDAFTDRQKDIIT